MQIDELRAIFGDDFSVRGGATELRLKTRDGRRVVVRGPDLRVVAPALTAEECALVAAAGAAEDGEHDYLAIASVVSELGVAEAAPVEEENTSTPPSIFRTTDVVIDKSKFVGWSARVESKDAALRVVSAVSAQSKRATHVMFAYTTTTQGKDNDDGGESGAGRKLADLLAATDATNAVVCVSRWYGGVKLGPKRFKLIARIAKEALDAALR